MLPNGKNNLIAGVNWANILYVDIHTHNKNKDKETLSLISCKTYDYNILSEGENFLSIGIHPWQVGDNTGDLLSEALNIFDKKNPVAIGEIGLDKFRNKAFFENQKEVFIQQIDYAESHKLPVVIHCVKAFSELLHILKSNSFTIPFIIHGFSQNIQIARQLMRYEVFFSFGSVLKFGLPKFHNLFREIPDNRVFFETDEDEISIKKVYEYAAKLSDKPVDFWINQVKNNFRKIFMPSN